MRVKLYFLPILGIFVCGSSFAQSSVPILAQKLSGAPASASPHLPVVNDPSIASVKVDSTGFYQYPTPKESNTHEVFLPSGDKKLMDESARLLSERNKLEIESKIQELRRAIAGPAGTVPRSVMASNSFDSSDSEGRGPSAEQIKAEAEARAKAAEQMRIQQRDDAEQQSVPEVIEIFGYNSNWRARVYYSNGNIAWVSVGDVIGNGLRVASINSSAVEFSSLDGKRHYARSVSDAASLSGSRFMQGGSSNSGQIFHPRMATPLTPVQ